MSQAAPSHDYAHPYSVIPAILSYIMPGLGQIVQGRIGKGVLFMVCLLGLFHVGQAMGNWQNVYLPKENPGNPLATIINNRWHFAGQVWIGAAAWPAILQYYDVALPGKDLGEFWTNYQKQPSEAAVNEFLVNSDKTPDLGWIYTVIAGMLNILVIYDAFAGPAYGASMHSTAPRTKPAGEAVAS